MNVCDTHSSFVHVLEERAETLPGRMAFAFLDDGFEESARLTYAALYRQAQAIAARLRETAAPGERVLLLYPSGREFVTGFFGCLFAGMTAVPAYPPKPNKSIRRLMAIAAGSDAKLAMAPSDAALRIKRCFSEIPVLSRLTLVESDAVPDGEAARFEPVRLEPGDLAFLQYTSGSTGVPKGVMVTHGNLLRNSEIIRQGFELDENDVSVSWLPSFHDMGLIDGILQPVYSGFPAILIPPVAFIQDPFSWLNAISKYRGTHGGGPNFGYDLCVQKIPEERAAGLDLSCWTSAYSGSEPVRRGTLEAFAGKFAPRGFEPRRFYPCYGLAEATLMVSGGSVRDEPVYFEASAESLERHEAVPATGGGKTRSIVGCGRPWLDTRIVIADPETRVALEPGRIGEIWVSGQTVAKGYINQPERTAETFGARLATGEGPFLRTGDLGFLRDGELFVTGRLKDVIIIRGRNHYPQDIEQTVTESHPSFRRGAGSCAAFAVETDGAEKLVIVQEIERAAMRSFDGEAAARAVCKAVLMEHELPVHAIAFIRPASIFKTSSGKVERRRCRRAFLEGELSAVAVWKSQQSADSCRPAPEPAPAPVPERDIGGDAPSLADEKLRWIKTSLAGPLRESAAGGRGPLEPHIVSSLAGQGLLGMIAPAEYGGLEFNASDMARIIEQLGAINQSAGLFVGLNNMLGIQPIMRFAAPAVRDEWLPKLAAGQALASFALSDPHGGSNPRSIETRAVPDGADHWRLHGTKIWSGSAKWAGVINVFAKQRGADGAPLGLAAFAVRRDAEGLEMGPEAVTWGMRGMAKNEFAMNGVRVSRDDMLGGEGRGMDVARQSVNFGRLGLSALALGGMKRCYQLMHRYASRRRVSTGLLLDNPYAMLRLSELRASIVACEGMVYALAGLAGQDGRLPEDLGAACKAAAAELFWRAADDLVQLVGGRACVESSAIPELLNDARVLRIFEGPTETLHMFVGANLHAGRTDLYDFLNNQLNAPHAAGELERAVEGVYRRLGRSSPFGGGAKIRAHLLAGELAANALLWAMAENVAWRPDAGLESGEWARARFARAAERSLGCPPDEIALADRSQLGRFADFLDHTMGTAGPAGEDGALDVFPHLPALERAGPDRDGFAPASAPADGGGTRSPNILREWIVSWLRSVMDVPPDAYHKEVTFAELGFDSLRAIQFAADFGEFAGTSFSENLVWEYDRVEQLIESAARPGWGDGEGAAPRRGIDLRRECELGGDAVPRNLSPARGDGPPGNVFLTGATGFLGAYLLRELLLQTDAAAHCLVRAGDESEGIKRIQRAMRRYRLWDESFAPRVRAVPGDLSLPLLGLDRERFAGLAGAADAIYHNAAMVNFICGYESLRRVNVDSTRDILRMAALGGGIPVHHVSTMAVFESPAYAGTEVDEACDVRHCEGMEMGYSQSKWVAEQLVMEAGRRGLPVSVYRPPLISGDGRAGLWNTDDFTCRFFKACVEMNAVPDLDLLLDLSPVDFVARAVVALSLRPDAGGRNYHLNNPKPWHWREFALWLGQYGYRAPLMPYGKWVRELEIHQRDPGAPLYALRPFFSGRRGDAGLTIPQMYERDRRPRISNARTMEELDRLNVHCPPVGEAAMTRYFNGFVDAGFLPPPGLCRKSG